MSQINLIWRISPDRRLTLNEPRLIGVVNVTPDSFSDGGRLGSVEDAVAHALNLVEQGASVIDIGGESTRPGAERVRAGEQIRRTRPVIAELRNRSDVAISIDTTLEPVAEAALDAGADIINDVSAGREDERIFDLAAERSCGLILMHRLAPPDEDSYSHQYEQKPRYDDVVGGFSSSPVRGGDRARGGGEGHRDRPGSGVRQDGGAEFRVDRPGRGVAGTGTSGAGGGQPQEFHRGGNGG